VRPLAVGVVTYNSAAVLPGLLDSLPAALAGVPSWRLVVADNASGDGSADLVRGRAPDALVRPMDGNLGYAAGVNAVAAAMPDADLLVLNPDIRLRPGSVSRLRGALGTPGVGIAVPRLAGPDGALALSLRRAPTVLRAFGESVLGGRRAARFAALGEVVGDRSAYDGPAVADWASGAAMLVSRDCLAAVGPWDESFFLYSEETDFALRARDAGYALRLVPGAEAVHLGGESHLSPALWSLLVSNKVRLYARRHGRGRAGSFWAALALGEALRSVRPSATHRAALRTLVADRRRLLEG